MKTTRLARLSSSLLLACAATLTPKAAEVPLAPPSDEDLRAHLEAEVPVYLEIAEVSFKPMGRPIRKVHAQMILRARENLYRLPLPDEPSVADLAGRPCLRIVTKADGRTPALNLEFPATGDAQGWNLGGISSNCFARLGAPANAYPANLLTEDGPEMQAARAEREKARKTESRRNTVQDITGVLDSLANTGLKVRSIVDGTPVVTNVPPARPEAIQPAARHPAPPPDVKVPPGVNKLLGGLFNGR